MKHVLIFIFALSALGISAQIDRSAIDSIVKSAANNALFEGTVLVADSDEVLYHKSYGFADEAGDQVLQNDFHYSIASVTKIFTAIVILQQVQESRLSLGDDLEKLLPDLDIPKANKITVHHLLLHISGLPNETDADFLQRMTAKEFATSVLKRRGGKFGRFNYANVDYVLLGLIAEKIDGKKWDRIVADRILGPCNMDDTGFLEFGDYPDPFAYTFSYGKGSERKKDPLFYIENFHAAGAMYSTSSDLLKLDRAMYTDLLLNDESKDLLYTSYPEYNYSGYSVWTYNYPYAESKPRLMERRGSILGANGVIIRFLDTRATIIILSNNDKFDSDTFGEVYSLKEALIIEVAKGSQ